MSTYYSIKVTGNRIKFAQPNDEPVSYSAEDLKSYKVEDGHAIFKFVTTVSKIYQVALTELLIGDAEDPITDEAEAQTALDELFLNAGGAASSTLQQVADNGNETTTPLLYKPKISPITFLEYDGDGLAGFTCTQEFIDYVNNINSRPQFTIDGNIFDAGDLQYIDGLVAYFGSWDEGGQIENYNGGVIPANFDDENTLITAKKLNEVLDQQPSQTLQVVSDNGNTTHTPLKYTNSFVIINLTLEGFNNGDHYAFFTPEPIPNDVYFVNGLVRDLYYNGKIIGRGTIVYSSPEFRLYTSQIVNIDDGYDTSSVRGFSIEIPYDGDTLASVSKVDRLIAALVTDAGDRIYEDNATAVGVLGIGVLYRNSAGHVLITF